MKEYGIVFIFLCISVSVFYLLSHFWLPPNITAITNLFLQHWFDLLRLNKCGEWHLNQGQVMSPGRLVCARRRLIWFWSWRRPICACRLAKATNPCKNKEEGEGEIEKWEFLPYFLSSSGEKTFSVGPIPFFFLIFFLLHFLLWTKREKFLFSSPFSRPSFLSSPLSFQPNRQ